VRLGALKGFLIAAICWQSLGAQAVLQDALLDFMYAKFAAVFTPPRVGEGPQEFLILASPGIGLNPSDLATPSHAVSQLLDQVPEPSRTYRGSGNLVSRIYERILDTAAITKSQDLATRNAALAAKRTLYDRSRPGQPTREYADFQTYQTGYLAAQDARSLALEESRAARKPLPAGLDQAVEAARKRWETLGHRASIQKALDAVQQAYERNPLVMFQNLRTELQKARLHDEGDWLPVTTYPPVEQWTTGTGWHPMTFQQADLRAPSAQDGTLLPARKGKAGLKAPDWAPGMALSVELKRVKVTRPWMDPALFGAHTWMLKEDAGFILVSTGNPADQAPGVMPIMITGLLLARKLSLTGYGTRDPGRLGPFDLGGTQPGRPAMAHRRIQTSAGAAIEVPDPQIVAFICQVVPKSPAPDPKVFR